MSVDHVKYSKVSKSVLINNHDTTKFIKLRKIINLKHQYTSDELMNYWQQNFRWKMKEYVNILILKVIQGNSRCTFLA